MAEINSIYESLDASKSQTYLKPTLCVYGTVLELTKGATGSITDGGTTKQPANQGSDPAIKENVTKVGEHPSGFGLYLFDYKPEYRARWGFARQFGVMADEVERIFPEAVSESEWGYRLVDYDMIGVVRSIH